MRGEIWLSHFARIIKSEYKEKQWTDRKWTKFMGDVLDCVAKKMNFAAVRRRPRNKEESWEYLGIDACFFDKSKYDCIDERSQWNPTCLPRAVVEHENRYALKIIYYALWKILCVRAPIKVLICYQDSKPKVSSLKKRLQGFILQGDLMKDTHDCLLVIVGNDSFGEDASWVDYFTVYEWRNDRLEKVRVPGW